MDEFDNKAKAIRQKIQEANKILVVASKPVDYDSLGTTLTIRQWLLLQNKEVKAYIFSDIADHIKHFPDISNIEQKYINNVDFNYYDLIILVDGNEFRQFFTNDFKKVVKDLNLEKVISIDHHQPGGIEIELENNALRKQDSCTAKVFYDYFLKDSIIKLTPEMAQYMYMSLIGDTGVFFYGIYPGTFSFAQELLDSGADHDKAVDLSIPQNMMEFMAWAIQKTEYLPEVESTILKVTKKDKDYLEQKFGEDWESQDLYRYYTNVVMRMVSGFPYSIILSLTKDENNIRLIYRVKNFGVNLNLMEVLNNAGINVKGHIKAGSGSLTGTIEEVEKKYIETLKNAKETFN